MYVCVYVCVCPFFSLSLSVSLSVARGCPADGAARCPVPAEQLYDYAFYPWEAPLLATAGRDGIVRVWRVRPVLGGGPGDGDAGVGGDAAECYLAGHEGRVDVLRFHPTATDLLASASWCADLPRGSMRGWARIELACLVGRCVDGH
jgi:hypothetical protein